MKRILISMYDMETGGAERSLINMLKSFDYSRYSVDLLLYSHTGDFLTFIPKEVKILPQIHAYTVFRKSVAQCLKERQFRAVAIRMLCKAIAAIKARARKLKEGSGYIQMQLVMKYSAYFLPKIIDEYDLAISYAWPHDIVARNVKAKKKIAWIHTDFSELEIDNNLDLTVWQLFDHIASVSDSCTNSFISKYPSLKERIVLIENITAPAFIKEMANGGQSLPVRNEDEFKIVSVGRLSFVKGYDLAITALRKLHDMGYNKVKWYVVGYGGYEEQLKSMITVQRLQDSFILLGKQTNPYPYMQACDLYVQPSRYEGKAVTVSEAKILGKPVLITKYPTAASQLIDGVDGCICDLSVEGLVEGIMKMINDVNFRNQVANNASLRNYGNEEELEKIYELIG